MYDLPFLLVSVKFSFMMCNDRFYMTGMFFFNKKITVSRSIGYFRNFYYKFGKLSCFYVLNIQSERYNI